MSQTNKEYDIHEFCDEWGHYVDTEKLNFTINNNEPQYINNNQPRRVKYNYKVLEKIYDEYDYYINNQTDIEMKYSIPVKSNIPINSNIPNNNNIEMSIIKSKKIDIPNAASTICCTIFLTTLLMFIL